MALAIFPTIIYESVPYGDADAFLDFNLVHYLAHIALAQKTGTAMMLLDDLRQNTYSHALMHKDVSAKLGLAINYDFASYDLTDRNSFNEFMLANSAAHQLLNVATGL